MHGIKVLMAKNYIDNLSKEARKGMQEKAEQGIWPPKCPLGYRNITGPEGKKIIATDPSNRTSDLQVVRMVRARRYFTEGSSAKGARRWPLDWVRDALHASHADEHREHEMLIKLVSGKRPRHWD
jgi:hypothetical protein